jgi:uncharacterized membrane protein YeaQ/YmgE (transglycosylase-associated protein family)
MKGAEGSGSMDILLWLIIGLVGGALGMLAAYRSTPSSWVGWVVAAGVGLVGGWIGGWLLGVLGLEATGWLGSLVVAFLGAWGILELVKRSGQAAASGPAGRRDTNRRR